MLQEIEKEYYSINRKTSFMLGDKESDYEAGIRFGVKSYILNKEEKKSIKMKTFQEILDLL
jgi:histidinol phosphatase-like enzyme